MMAAKKDFDIGELVWAKMKGFPFWPGKIASPPTDVKSTLKKAQHYVFFFGSENYAWILDENIVHHSEEMLQSTSTKKKSTLLKTAIEKIIEEAPQKTESLVKQKESSEVITSSTERKIARKQNDKSPKVKKRIALKRRVLDETLTPSRKMPCRSEALSVVKKDALSEVKKDALSEGKKDALSEVKKYTLSKTDSPPVARVKPLEIFSTGTSGIANRNYFELQPDPVLNLYELSETLKEKNVTPDDKNIGFIGLGMMGQRIVRNLLITKHKVTIWNRTTEKCEEFAKAGASVAQTPGDVVEKCDIIMCCVSDPNASTNLVFGNCGILAGLEKSPPGSKCYVEMTTMDPITSAKNAEAIIKKNGRYLEAPIIGSRKMAEEGDIVILSAGDSDLFLECETIFYSLSKYAFFLGLEVGTASKHNLVHSTLMGITQGALAEAIALLERTNLKLENFLEILDFLPLNSHLIAEKKVAIQSRNFATNNRLKYQQRDMTLALSLSNMCRQRMLVATATNEMFKRAKLLRYSDHDASAVFLGAKY